MRGRKPEPTHLRLVKGNPSRRPLPKDEPKPRVALRMPDPPSHLNAPAKREWRRKAPELHRIGLLTKIDDGALAAYCYSYGIWVEATKELAKVKRKMAADGKEAYGGFLASTKTSVMVNPLVTVARDALRDMMRVAVEFGMTPSARTRIEAEPPSDRQPDPARHEDPAAEFLA